MAKKIALNTAALGNSLFNVVTVLGNGEVYDHFKYGNGTSGATVTLGTSYRTTNQGAAGPTLTAIKAGATPYFVES